MNLKGIELTALLSAGMMMSNADGNIADEEKDILINELKSFNVTDEEAELCFKLAIDMTTDQTIEVLKAMSEEAKTYAYGYLAAVLLCDGQIEENEKKALAAFCNLCEFPSMTVGEALQFWANN